MTILQTAFLGLLPLVPKTCCQSQENRALRVGSSRTAVLRGRPAPTRRPWTGPQLPASWRGVLRFSQNLRAQGLTGRCLPGHCCGTVLIARHNLMRSKGFCLAPLGGTSTGCETAQHQPRIGSSVTGRPIILVAVIWSLLFQ